MARPPLPAAPMPAPAAGATPPDDMGGMPDAAMAPEEAAPEWEVFATIMKNEAGEYKLVQGDEPEEGEGDMPEGGESEGETFPTPQALIKGLMLILNDGGAAEDAFAGGFKGDKGEPASPAAM